MQIKSKLFTLPLLCFSFLMYAQSGKQKRADSLFSKYAFVKAAKIYQNLADKNYNREYALGKLADCFNYLRNPKKAVVIYGELVNNEDVEAEYYYKYAYALRGVEKYEESKKWFQKYKEAGGTISEDYLEKPLNFLVKLVDLKDEYILSTVPFNTHLSDIGAFQYGDNVYFASTRDKGVSTKRLYSWNEQPFLDMYVYSKNIDTINHKEKLKGDVNTKFHDGPAVITKDGKTMYFTRNDYTNNKKGKDSKGVNNLKIYRATFKDSVWTNIEDLNINSREFSTMHPALSPDEKSLYFAAANPSGFGGSDIYVADINSDGTIGVPKNLGSKINTSRSEGTPFMNSKGILYFSSDGHPGLGLMDVFVTITDNNGIVKDVLNLGSPINSSMDDIFFTMDASGENGYISSNREGGLGDDDIYSFLYIKPLVLEGIVKNKINNKLISNASISLMDENGNVLTNIKSNKRGFYSIIIDRNANFNIEANKEKFETTNLAFNSNVDRKQVKIEKNILLNPIKEVKVLAGLNKIYFDLDKHRIRPDAAIELDKIARIMNDEYPTMIIRIESHTDSRATNKYNDGLSKRRANSTYEYLVKRGVDKSRIISAEGFGESKLTNDCANNSNCSESLHQMNRRTEFVIVKM